MSMHASSEDMKHLVDQIGHRCNPIQAMARAKGVAIPSPLAKRIKVCVKTHGAVVARYRKGDFRHSSAELKDIGQLAQFLMNLHNEMSNDERRKNGKLVEPLPQLEIDERRMVRKQILYG